MGGAQRKALGGAQGTGSTRKADAAGDENAGDGVDESDVDMTGVSLVALPTNGKALLATGLLEGVWARYVDNWGRELLVGRIQGTALLCFCAACKGKKVGEGRGRERRGVLCSGECV